ncbi:MAG: hypothetical protein IPP51_10550 [Bacteroidetes bacterium]|nr:hypothetical protein [Bacteroidota bacterium]
MLTRNNYETWFIDYHDGALSKTQVAELFAFLEKNTDLKAEFEFFNSVSLEPEEITFSGKESLKRSLIDQTNYLNWFVSYVENDLSESDRKLVEEFLKAHPELLKELELIIKTKSIPDYTIIFKDKSSLRKTAKVLTFSRTVYRSLSIAASIVLIAVAYYFIQLRGKQKEEFAHQDQTEKSVAPSNTLPQGSEKELANQSDVETQPSNPKKKSRRLSIQKNTVQLLRKIWRITIKRLSIQRSLIVRSSIRFHSLKSSISFPPIIRLPFQVRLTSHNNNLPIRLRVLILLLSQCKFSSQQLPNWRLSFLRKN